MAVAPGCGEDEARTRGKDSNRSKEQRGRGRRRGMTGRPHWQREKRGKREGCRVGLGQKGKAPKREGDKKGSFPEKVSFVSVFLFSCFLVSFFSNLIPIHFLIALRHIYTLKKHIFVCHGME